MKCVCVCVGGGVNKGSQEIIGTAHHTMNSCLQNSFGEVQT